MEKIIVNVPKGIRYISEWKEFNFRNFPNQCIINKQLPGCGFTEWCIRNSDNVIIGPYINTEYNELNISRFFESSKCLSFEFAKMHTLEANR